jgi:hypothetical protein
MALPRASGGSRSRRRNVHWAEPTKVVVDDDAREEYQRLRKKA